MTTTHDSYSCQNCKHPTDDPIWYDDLQTYSSKRRPFCLSCYLWLQERNAERRQLAAMWGD